MRLILRVGERALGYWQCFVQGDRSFTDSVSKGRPLHQLQHQRTGAFAFFKPVDSRARGA